MEKRTKTLVGVLILALVVVSGLAGGVLLQRLPMEPPMKLTGILYFNDSGEAHGGFEMAVQWNVTLAVRGGVGVLVVTPDPDQLGNDALKKWSYTVTGFQRTDELIVMALDGHVLQLPFVKNDTVWNLYLEMYVLRTPDLKLTIFLGLLSSYYVELRLRIALIPRGDGN